MLVSPPEHLKNTLMIKSASGKNNKKSLSLLLHSPLSFQFLNFRLEFTALLYLLLQLFLQLFHLRFVETLKP